MISSDDRDLSVALVKQPGPLCRPPAPQPQKAPRVPSQEPTQLCPIALTQSHL